MSPRTRWARVSSWAFRSDPVTGRDSGASADAAGPLILHATTVAANGRAALIRGTSGSGKSGLALALIGLGAGLVADDRTRLRRTGDQVIADAPEAIRGRIEARGVGIMGCPAAGPVPLALIVDMDRPEPERLPPWGEEKVLDISLPILGNPGHPHFPSAILLYLMYGRVD